MIPCDFMTSELKLSALVATIDLIENGRKTQTEFMTTYVKQFSLKWKSKSQNLQTKEIINVLKREKPY